MRSEAGTTGRTSRERFKPAGTQESVGTDVYTRSGTSSTSARGKRQLACIEVDLQSEELDITKKARRSSVANNRGKTCDVAEEC